MTPHTPHYYWITPHFDLHGWTQTRPAYHWRDQGTPGQEQALSELYGCLLRYVVRLPYKGATLRELASDAQKAAVEAHRMACLLTTMAEQAERRPSPPRGLSEEAG